MYKNLRKLWRDKTGLAAVEFAFIAPLMILLYLGVVELSDAMIANRKLTTATSTMADLVAQGLTIDDDEMSDILLSAQAIMAPYAAADMQIRVTSVNVNLDGTTVVGWSDAVNMSPLSTGGAYTLPGDIGQPGGSIIVSEATFTHEAMTVAGNMVFGPTITFSDNFYLEPRRTLRVTRDTN